MYLIYICEGTGVLQTQYSHYSSSDSTELAGAPMVSSFHRLPLLLCR